MEHWHDCESYRAYGFDCPGGLHEPEEAEEPEMERERAQEVAFPWEFLLPTATAIALRGVLETYFFEDADADKIRRFPSPRRMPDIPEELAAIVAGVAFMLLLRGSARTLGTARAAERLAVSGMAVVPPGPGRQENIVRSVPVRRSTGTVESPFGKDRSGTRFKKKKRRELSPFQAGQFQSYGEWWYQAVDPSHTWAFYRGSERFNPADLPEWIQWRPTLAEISSVNRASQFNEMWERDYGRGGVAPWSEDPGN